MTSHPAPGTTGYDEWLDHQMSLADHVLDQERFERALPEMAADEAISVTIATELAAAVRHAVQWLDVPTVLRTVATVVEAFDQEQADDPDAPF